MANKKNNNLGIFAAVFAVIFGATYGTYKAIANAGENSELRRLKKAIDELFLEGKSEHTIVEALIMNASKQMGKKPNQDGIDKIKAWVLEEKIKLRKEGKIGEDV